MSKLLRDSIGLVPEKDLNSIMEKDAQAVALDVNVYKERNSLAYYVLINTWLLMIREYTIHTWDDVRDLIYRSGLLPVIGLFDEAASKLVSEGQLSVLCAADSLPISILNEVDASIHKRIILKDPSKEVGVDTMATALQLFRYPKRFSPLAADKLRDNSLSEFKQNQNRLKLLQRREHPWWLISMVRREIGDLLPWSVIIDEIAEMKLCDIEFTNGVGVDSRAPLGSKLQAMLDVLPDFFSRSSFENLRVFKDVEVNDGWTTATWPKHVVEVRAVPKSYKKARIIAMEETYRQAVAKRVFTIVSRYLPANLDIHDQSRNQRYAKEGSITGSLATLDLTSASDDIQVNLVYEVYPVNFVDLLDFVRPTHYRIRGSEAILHSYMTMGNSMTFVLETILFAAIARVACRLSGSDPSRVSVYGDDIVVPSESAETSRDLLTMLGFRLNESKSYWSGSYRESCGEEYFGGICVSSYYYPRFAVEGQLGPKPSVSKRTLLDAYTGEVSDAVSRLVSLQHRLSAICEDGSRFLAEVIQEMSPKMTRSLGFDGSTTSDIWARVARPAVVSSPYAVIEEYDKLDPTLGRTSKALRFKRTQGHDEEAYSTPIPIFPKLEEKPERRKLYDIYRYNKFLKDGPRYKDPLSRLLRVSEPDASYDEVFGSAEIKWFFSIFTR